MFVWITLWVVGCGMFECCCMHLQYLSFFPLAFFYEYHDIIVVAVHNIQHCEIIICLGDAQFWLVEVDFCGEEAVWQPGQPAMCDANSLCAEHRSFRLSDGKERRRTYHSWAGERESYFKRSHSHAAVRELLQTNSVVQRQPSGTGFQHRFQHRVTTGRPWKRGEIHLQVLSADSWLGCVVWFHVFLRAGKWFPCHLLHQGLATFPGQAVDVPVQNSPPLHPSLPPDPTPPWWAELRDFSPGASEPKAVSWRHSWVCFLP